ncbi:MAG: SusC/RagA family TonB-linked outer membrane protein [Microscillaceae bacterium]|nr:SusC/RagA family TonB-linked outer membrane protein [Microscillaceae bacterium]
MKAKLPSQSSKKQNSFWDSFTQQISKVRYGIPLFCILCLTAVLNQRVSAQELASYQVSHAHFKSTSSQEQTISLKKALKNLELKHNVSFNYDSKIIEDKYVPFDQNAQSDLEQTLEKILDTHRLKYFKIDEKTYVIQSQKSSQGNKNRVGSSLNSIKTKQFPVEETQNREERNKKEIRLLKNNPIREIKPDKTVSGIVTDVEGIGLPGVNVIVKNTSIGTTTDASGKFSVNVPDNQNVLIFSSVGYLTQEIEIGNQTTFSISMKEDVGQLQELVVVGYGSQERAKVTGAVASISSEDISNLPVLSADQAIQGKAAGVTIISTGGPGENPLVRIRGVGTVNNNNPLYVIDGVPAGGLNSINPNDIESIEVLKDASTVALYGSRASNGVILITTKKGVAGKPKINFDAYAGSQTAWKQLDLLNREQYIDYGTDLLTNANAALPARFNNLGEFANVDTDWQDEMFRTGLIQDYNISVNGGNENFTYNIGTGYFAQEGIMLGTSFDRISFRANTEVKIGKRVKIGQTLTLAESERIREQFSGGRSQIEHMIKSVPYLPVRDESRVGGFRTADTQDGSDPENPVLNATLRQDKTRDFRMLGTAYLEVDIYKGLKAKAFIGLDVNFSRNVQFAPIYDPGDFHKNVTADISKNNATFISPIYNVQLMYDRKIGKHNISALGIIEGQTFSFENVSVAGETDQSSVIQQPGFFQIGENIGGGLDENQILSYIGRVTYDFADKYLLTLSLRRDGSSKFAEDIRWGSFPAVSLGWRVSEESFMQGISSVVNEFKIRGSYGEAGNNLGASSYGYIPSIFSDLSYGVDKPGGTINTLSNANLLWETTKMFNVGFDAAFLDNKLTVSFDWFRNTTEDMILGLPIPPSLGFDGAPIGNAGTARNTGVEILLGYRQNFGDFQFSFNGNLALVTNEFTSLGNGNSIFGPGFEGDPLTLTEEGQPIAYFYGWKTDGLFQSQDEIDAANALDGNDATPYQSNAIPGDIRFKDLNNDGVINTEDRTNIGHFLPDVSYGFTLGANWKNFDLSVFFQGVAGNEILNTNRYDLEGMTRLFNAGTAVLRRWTPENTNTDIPIARNSDPNRNSRISDRFVEDGSYLRLKNLTLGYNLPESALPKRFISRIRVYFTAQNLFTITDYSGYDPEIGVRGGVADDPRAASLVTGVDFGQFPQPRTFIGGIQIGF